MITHHTHSSLETIKIGEKYAGRLRGGEVICLYGELGSGKTTFTKGLAKGLGIKNRLLSPTFIIVRQYKIEGKSFTTLYHLDLYRLNNSEDVRNIGLNDWLSNKENITVIEWPEKLEESLPQKRIDISFSYTGEDKRSIAFDEKM